MQNWKIKDLDVKRGRGSVREQGVDGLWGAGGKQIRMLLKKSSDCALIEMSPLSKIPHGLGRCPHAFILNDRIFLFLGQRNLNVAAYVARRYIDL